jgi:hypothetical protein
LTEISRENKSVPWNPADFHPLVFSTLQEQSSQPIPLSASEFHPRDLPPDLLSTDPEQLFPKARDAKAALSGLLLIAGHWDLSHQVAQDIPSREGSYWHAIGHRIEPDSSNSAYWFRRVGQHPIFAALHERAALFLSSSNTGWRLKREWDPHLFLIWCDESRNLPQSEKHALAIQIQGAECELLLSWCALKLRDL